MKKMAAAFALIVSLVGPGCSSSPPNPLLGTWKSDHDLTVASIRRDSEPGQKLDDEMVERIVGPDATVSFTRDAAVFDVAGAQALHFEYAYTIVSSDAHATTITITDRSSGSAKTDVFHFDDNNVLWLDNQIGNTNLPIHAFRQYFKRQH
jgi:hypothetical protein